MAPLIRVIHGSNPSEWEAILGTRFVSFLTLNVWSGQLTLTPRERADCWSKSSFLYFSLLSLDHGGVTTPASYETAILKTVFTSASPHRIGTLSAPQPFFCEKYLFFVFLLCRQLSASCSAVVCQLFCQNNGQAQSVGAKQSSETEEVPRIWNIEK